MPMLLNITMYSIKALKSINIKHWYHAFTNNAWEKSTCCSSSSSSNSNSSSSSIFISAL